MEDLKTKFKNMDYSTFVGLIKERNRPSGGIKTVHEVAVNSFIDSNKKVLEIGSNTGFTSINLSLLTNCSCDGIDINQDSIEESNRLAKLHKIDNKVKFIKSDATKLPFDNQTFDIVWCSNVTSFIKDKKKAFTEYMRVLKTGGILVLIPIYYIKTPPKKLVDEVSEAINSTLEIYKKEDWIKMVEEAFKEDKNFEFELFYEKDYEYVDIEENIPDYLKEILDKSHITSRSAEEINEIRIKAKYFMTLFNDNLKYAGYSTLLFQKRIEKEEIELFVTKEKKNETK